MLACCYSNSPPLCRRCLDVGADKRTFKADFSLSECDVERERELFSRSPFYIVRATSEGILNGLCIKNLPSLQFCAASAHFRRLVLFGLKAVACLHTYKYPVSRRVCIWSICAARSCSIQSAAIMPSCIASALLWIDYAHAVLSLGGCVNTLNVDLLLPPPLTRLLTAPSLPFMLPSCAFHILYTRLYFSAAPSELDFYK
jgi:hypothetical protein